MSEGIREGEAELDGCRVAFTLVTRSGAPDMIVFLHGLGCDRDSFRAAPHRKELSGSSILMIDLPGFGGSTAPPGFAYTIEDHASICCRLIETLPPAVIHLAGHSMGGAVALMFPPGFPGKLGSFSNLEGNLIAEDCGLLSSSIAGVTLEEYSSDLFWKHRSEFASDAVLRFGRTTPEAVYKSARSLVDLSFRGELLDRFMKLPARKAYFHGERNKDMEVLGRLGDTAVFSVPGAGHAMMTDNPDSFYGGLARFIHNIPSDE